MMKFKHKNRVCFSIITILGLIFTINIVAFVAITSFIKFMLVLETESLYSVIICLFIACIVAASFGKYCATSG